MEEWKACEFDSRYKISNFGNIKRILCSGKDRILKPSVLNKGKTHQYYYFQVTKEGKRKNHLIHRLVALAFCEGHSEDNNVCDHIDRNTFNNHFSNLRWGTQKDNMKNTLKYKSHIPEKDHKKLLDKEYQKTIKQSNKFYCELCDLSCSGSYNLNVHNSGRSHKLKEECRTAIGEKYNTENYLIWRNNRYPKNKHIEYV